MAAPFVSGAAALLRQQKSSASYSEIKAAIRDHGDAVTALSGKVKSGSRLNVLRALDAID